MAGNNRQNTNEPDLQGRQAAAGWWLGPVLFAVSGAYFLAMLSWAPFPGLPVALLLKHLGAGLTGTDPMDLLWGGVIRLLARAPGLPVESGASLFSAFCGAAGAGLFGQLLSRVSYRGWRDLPEASRTREVQARRISGLVGGFYLACCIPYGVVSTRSLPGAFHLLLLLAAAWFFSEYQQSGKRRHLGLAGGIYGVALTEYATAWIFLPMAVFLVERELFWRKRLRADAPQVVFWGCLLVGLLLYPLNALTFSRHAASLGVAIPPWQAGLQILQAQFFQIAHVRYTPGSLIILFFSLVPWLMLFVFSRRAPWYYEFDQVVVRLVFTGGLLAVLYNAPFALWRLLGMWDLMVAPYVLQAVCIGYMAGEFWIVGEARALRKVPRKVRLLRGGASVLALALPGMIVAGSLHNRIAVDGRGGRAMMAAAADSLDRLEGRDILFTTGLLDDYLELAVWQRQAPVRIIRIQQAESPVYARHLAGRFPEKNLHEPLLKGEFGQFLDRLLLSDAGPGRIAFIDMPEVFRKFGQLVPDGLVYRLVRRTDAVDLPALLAAQASFREQMEVMAARPVPEANLAHPFHNQLRLLASKMVNNLGVMQAVRGDVPGARETFRAGRRIHSENLSLLMNLLETGRHTDVSEAADLEAEWERRLGRLTGEQWVLAIRYGYVWQADEWVRRGRVWALSGAIPAAEADQPDSGDTQEDALGYRQFMDLAYVTWGTPFLDETHYRTQLMKNEQDTEALTALCRLALRRKDWKSAEAYLAEALSKGLPESDTLFDRAMVTYARGEREQTIAELREVTRLQPGEARAWMGLLLLTDAHDPVNRQALRELKKLAADRVDLRLELAWVHMTRQQWAEAQTELELAVQLDARNSQTWEMMMCVAQARSNQALWASSLRTLLAQYPAHPFRYLQSALRHDLGGEPAQAEADLRTGLRYGRNPDLLNALARIIMKQNDRLPDARACVDEALRRQPFNPTYRCTRIELDFAEGRIDEGERDLQQVLRDVPGHVQGMLLLIQWHLLRGEKPEALELARALGRRRGELSAEQLSQLKKWAARIRKS